MKMIRFEQFYLFNAQIIERNKHNPSNISPATVAEEDVENLNFLCPQNLGWAIYGTFDKLGLG